jgi:predicted ArsR family transcriptional regulator
MTQALLDFDAPAYPWQAGHRGVDTSRAAAASIDADALRGRVLATLDMCGPMTPDECAQHMGESVLSIRPRFTELSRLGSITRTGHRRANASGRSAHVFSVSNNQPKEKIE